MSDTNIVTENVSVSQNHLAHIVVGLTRALSMEREAHESTRLVLHEAVAMLSHQDRQLDRERANRLHLLAQYREVTGARTTAKESEPSPDAPILAMERAA